MRLKATLFATLLVAVTCGCASSGKAFRFENRDKVVLGETGKDEAIELFGSPLRTETASSDKGNFETLKYVYSRAWGYPGGAVALVRVMFLEFRGEILNGFIYTSSFSEDHTDFDETGVQNIKKGASTKADVIGILGKPSGQARCPSSLGDFSNFCESCSEVWKWVYTWDAGPTMKSKHVTIGFDDKGVVASINSESEI